MQNKGDLIVILGTGGTIAGTAADPGDNVGYKAAQLSVEQLVASLPGLADRRLETEQVAQIDSKNMDFATWQKLAERLAQHLARPEVGGIVITHGTDTLEETGQAGGDHCGDAAGHFLAFRWTAELARCGRRRCTTSGGRGAGCLRRCDSFSRTGAQGAQLSA